MEEYDKHLKDVVEAEQDRLTLKKAKALTMDRESMLAHDYVIEVPDGPGGNIPTEEGGNMKCERCAADYIVHGNMTEVFICPIFRDVDTVLTCVLITGREDCLRLSLGTAGSEKYVVCQSKSTW